MKKRPSIPAVQQSISAWYRRVGRDLPWRRTRDPYAIAVSEVMLQQTQVDRVKPKFLAWRRAWPTTKLLARAPLSAVLKQWSGLGYNSRAMRLRLAAQIVMEKHNGHWPQTVAELESLPGFGPYTAAAVATFAYQQRVPVIDTNIRRVIGRIFFGPNGAPSEKKLAKTVVEILPTRRPDLWNHALMDLGAMVCVARKPKCEECPVKNLCRAYPEILTTPVVKKNLPLPKFETTDRFWRGRVVAMMVQKRHWSLTALRHELQALGNIDSTRLQRIVDSLVSAGLLVRRGKRITFSS